MKVAEQRDGEALQAGGPAAQRNFLAHDSRTVGLEQDGVGGQSAHARRGCEAEELSSGDGKKSQSAARPLDTAKLRRTQVSLFRIT